MAKSAVKAPSKNAPSKKAPSKKAPSKKEPKQGAQGKNMSIPLSEKSLLEREEDAISLQMENKKSHADEKENPTKVSPVGFFPSGGNHDEPLLSIDIHNSEISRKKAGEFFLSFLFAS